MGWERLIEWLRRRAVTTLVTAMLATLGGAGCGHPAEDAALDRFFAASRLRDRTALQSMATVTFEPAWQGIVTRFVVTRVTPVEQNGGTASKSVTVSAPIELPDGTIAPRTLFVTMQRIGDAPWMITGVTVAAAPASPRPR